MYVYMYSYLFMENGGGEKPDTISDSSAVIDTGVCEAHVALIQPRAVFSALNSRS